MRRIREIKKEDSAAVKFFLTVNLEMNVLFSACFEKVHPLYFEGYIEEKDNALTAVLLRLFGVWYIEIAADSDREQICAFLNLMQGKAEVCGRKSVIDLLQPDFQGVKEIVEAPFLELCRTQEEKPAAKFEGKESLEEVYRLLSQSETFALNDAEDFYLTRQTLLTKGIARTRGIVQEGKLVATASSLFESKEAAMLGAVCTAKEEQGKGLASMLMKSLCAEIQQENKRIFLAAYHPAALHLYQKMGFEKCGIKKVLRF